MLQSTSVVVFVLVSALLVGLLARAYHRWQNEHAGMGGAISKPKTTWLFFALYQYFILSSAAWLYLPPTNRFQGVLALFAGLMYFRLVAQGVLMFWVKQWTPPMGIAHNLAGGLLVGGAWVAAAMAPGAWNTSEMALAAWLVMVVLMLWVDTYYAAVFYRLVGRGSTKGEAAIWYASAEDPRFVRINRVTRGFNVFFMVYFAALWVAYVIKG